MEKILVNVFVPILGVSYDIFIPIQSQLYEITELVKRAVFELSEGRFIASQDTVLSLRSSGEIFDINSTIFELEIKNGTKLMLI